MIKQKKRRPYPKTKSKKRFPDKKRFPEYKLKITVVKEKRAGRTIKEPVFARLQKTGVLVFEKRTGFLREIFQGFSRALVKLTVLLLIITLNWTGLAAIGQTFGYFSDTENSAQNYAIA